MIVGIGNNNVFIIPQTESVRRIELPFSRTQLAETNPSLHWDVLWIRCDSSTAITDAQTGARRC